MTQRSSNAIVQLAIIPCLLINLFYMDPSIFRPPTDVLIGPGRKTRPLYEWFVIA